MKQTTKNKKNTNNISYKKIIIYAGVAAAIICLCLLSAFYSGVLSPYNKLSNDDSNTITTIMDGDTGVIYQIKKDENKNIFVIDDKGKVTNSRTETTEKGDIEVYVNDDKLIAILSPAQLNSSENT